ncbi:MAG: 16S rRNA (uracil(1498)-N(3))-methyltransferase [Pseudomonadota bacterium]
MTGYDFRKIRVFLPDDLIEGARVPLSQAAAHYLGSVMRVAVGTEILAFNGRDGEWIARVDSYSKKSGTLAIERQSRPQDRPLDLDYCFAPVKRAPLDFLVQKATELGVARLRPVITRHTIVSRLKEDRLVANAREAAEQSGRLTVPGIETAVDLDRLIDGLDPDRRLLFCDEAGGAPPIKDALAPYASLPPAPWAILIGPEGGFHEEERSRLLRQPNVVPVSLGPRIMRADTAGLAALAVWQSVLGDWRAEA